MPTYQGQVSEEGLIDLVEYIKNLNSNYRIQQTLPGQSTLTRDKRPRRPRHRSRTRHSETTGKVELPPLRRTRAAPRAPGR